MKTGVKIIGGILQLIGGALCLYSGLAFFTGQASEGSFILTVVGLILIFVGNLMSKSKK